MPFRTDVRDIPYIFGPATEVSAGAGTRTFETGANGIIVYVPFRTVRSRLRVTGFRLYETGAPTGTGTKRLAFALYKDCVYNATVGSSSNPNNIGRYLPNNVAYSETFNVITGGVYKGNLFFDFTNPVDLVFPRNRVGGNIFYGALQIEGGYTGGTIRTNGSRSTFANVHHRSEVGAFPLPFSNAPTGTYREDNGTVTLNAGTPSVDNLAYAIALVTE